MKKIICIFSLAACMLFSGKSFAQFQWGLRAGFQMTTQTNDVNSDNLKHPLIPGANAGVFGEYFFSDNMSVTADLLYSLEGFRDKYDNYKFTVRFHDIDLPIAFNYYVMGNRLGLQVGPELGFTLASNYNYKYESKNFGIDKSGEVEKEAYNLFNVGIMFGLNYFFTENCFAGLRGLFGLTNALNEYKLKSDSWEAVNSKNIVLSLNAGYRF